MALSASNIVAGNKILATDVKQFYDLLVGTTTDQPVTLKNMLTLTRVAAAAPSFIPYLKVTGIADTLVAGEAQDVLFDFGRTVQIAGGSIPASNRSLYVKRATLASSSVQTLALASTVAIQGAPVAGTNLTITKTLALEVETGDVRLTTGILWLGTLSVTYGSASPEASVTAEPGSVYLRTNGTFWRKASGSGNTGWSQVGGMTIGATYRGTITLANAVATNTATITAVVTANSQLRNLGASAVGVDHDSTSASVRIDLTNTTTITATRIGTTQATVVSYELTEWI